MKKSFILFIALVITLLLAVVTDKSEPNEKQQIAAVIGK